METYYQVTHQNRKGIRTIHKRDTVERAYAIYKSLINDREYDVKLEEVSNNGIAILRAGGIFHVKEEPPKKEPQLETQPRQPQTLFEMMFGISKEEYNECLTSWNRMTGENVELLD